MVGEGTTEEDWKKAPDWQLVEIDNTNFDHPNRFQWNRPDFDRRQRRTKSNIFDVDDKSGKGSSSLGPRIISTLFGEEDDCEGDIDEDDDEDSTNTVTVTTVADNEATSDSNTTTASDDAQDDGESDTESDDPFSVHNFTKVMLNTDIALVRTLGDNISADGDVACNFRFSNACPAADTLE